MENEFYFRIERFGSCCNDSGNIILRNRKETSDFLDENGLWNDKYKKEVKELWKDKEGKISLMNLRLPCALELEYIYKCNLRCKYCYAYSSPFRNETIPFDNFKRLIKSIDRSDVFDVYVLGGEPCILPNYLEYLLNNLHNKFIIIVSNLTLINKKICEYVRNSHNHVEFCVTIDGAEKDIHNSTRGLFDKVCRGLDFLREYSIPIRVNSCVTPYNFDKLEDILKFLIPYNIVTIKFSPVGTNHLPREIVNELDISKNYKGLMEHLFELQTRYRHRINIDMAFDSEMNLNFDRSNEMNTVIYGLCTAGVIKAGIDINGEIVPCVSTSSKIKIPFKGSFEDAFETLKLEILKSGRKIIEQNNMLRVQNCCQIIGYGKEKPICEIKTIKSL